MVSFYGSWVILSIIKVSDIISRNYCVSSRIIYIIRINILNFIVWQAKILG